MVFFICNNCGESIKKASVEKHYFTKCRKNPKNISCMDCQKDFHGEEYGNHIKCISEAQKYSGKNFVAKENIGEKRQEKWTHIVHSILESTEYELSGQIRDIFERMRNFDNVPRKKAKFQNYVANCLRISPKQAEPVWSILEKELGSVKKVEQQQKTVKETAIIDSNQTNNNGDSLKRNREEDQVENINTKKLKKQNTKANQIEEQAEAAIRRETNSFQWFSVMEKILKKHPEGLSLDKLKKNLLKKYKSELKLEELSEKEDNKFQKKFINALRKCPSIQVDGEMVKFSCQASTDQSKNNLEEECKLQNGLKYNQDDVEDENISKKEETQPNTVKENGKLATESSQWCSCIEKIVAKNSEGLPLDKLKEKFLKKYKSKLNIEELSKKQQKKFEKNFTKALQTCPAVQIVGEVVKPSCQALIDKFRKDIDEAQSESKRTNTVEDNGETASAEGTEIFQCSALIEKLVAKHPEGLPLEQLKVKLIKKYKSKLNLEMSTKKQEKLENEFIRLLRKCPAVKLDGETVKPC